MTFQPVLPLGGFAGWSFLQRTLDTQQETFNQGGLIARETAYFRENIASVQTAEDLVNDRQLLKVALGAYGLEDDINNRAFIQQILEGGTDEPDALANRLTDVRYRQFSDAFGFGNFTGSRTPVPAFAEQVIEDYQTRQFEVAVGNQDTSLRLALGLERDLGEIASGTLSVDSKWFAVMGNPPLRQVFETALALPPAFGTVDLEQQLEVFKERAQSAFGTDDIADFADAEVQDELVRRFFALDQINTGFQTQTGASAALTLLQGALR